MKKPILVLLSGLGLVLSALPVQAAECIGSCGVSTTNDGWVTLAPGGGSQLNWISTNGGASGVGQLPDIGGTNGTLFRTDPFFAAANSTVSFSFNYVTSDGSGYADYAWAMLRAQGGNDVILYTARTQPSGTIVPGFGLPGVAAQLMPTSVPIIGGNPIWSPLGSSSNTCYSAGCGMTGWVNSQYIVQGGGTYTLEFGVSNWGDTAYQSGMAFDGLQVNGSIIGDGSSAGNPLLPDDLVNGAFVFSNITPPANQFIWIDPLIAVGYEYKITAGNNSILEAIFPTLAGDTDGYEVFSLGGDLLGTVAGGQTFSFGGGVQGFVLKDIDEAAMIDPANPSAFVTGLKFASSDLVSLTQTPLTADVGGGNVPEPGSLVLALSGGLALLGRRRLQRQAA